MAVNKSVSVKKPSQRQAKLDWLNFAYGIGAAIVIIGAMMKFMNYTSGNTALMIGLMTEAIVFFISAFEFKKEDLEYRWEKIFPQLTKDGETKVEQIEEMLEKANLDPMVIERLTRSIERLEENVSKMNEVSETVSLNEQLQKMKQTTEAFEREISRLNASVAEMNGYYMRMLDAMGNKRSTF